MTAPDTGREALEQARRGRRTGWPHASLCRSSPGLRGDEPACVRGAAAVGPSALVRQGGVGDGGTHDLAQRGDRGPLARLQVEQLARNRSNNCFTEFGLGDRRQEIIHAVGPEQGATVPGMTVAAGGSHTSTHGALAALAFGVGTSEVEHVLATLCLSARWMRSMLVRIDGELQPGVAPKDRILHTIGRLGVAGGTGYVIEFDGSAVCALSMEGRMRRCNMVIEVGARVDLVAVNDKTIDYVREGRLRRSPNTGPPRKPTGGRWSAMKGRSSAKALSIRRSARCAPVRGIDCASTCPRKRSSCPTGATSVSRWRHFANVA